MEPIIAKGRSVDEAVLSGLTILESEREDVHVLVMKNRKHRFVFLRKAVVQMTRKVPVKKESLSNFVDDLLNSHNLQEPAMQDFKETGDGPLDREEGKAWIKNGMVHCKTTARTYPILTVPANFRLLINGNESAQKTVVLSDEEVYELTPKSITQPTEWEITMDAHKLDVQLSVVPGYQADYTLLNSAPKQHLEPRFVENKTIQNTLQMAEVIRKVGALRVKTGFNHAEMLKASQTTENQTFSIATGRPAVQGRNGWFESSVSTRIKQGLKENESGRVNFREVKSIPVVEEGTLIGVIHDPLPGRIGCTVTNDPIPFQQTYPVKIQAGEGVIVIGNKVIATESGRPQISQIGLLVKINIVKKLIVPGDVDLASGNVTFKGDVEVFGGIAANMTVDAEGDAVIHKAVTNAAVNSSRSVTLLGNCSGSVLTAAEKDFFEKPFFEQLKRLLPPVEQIIALLDAVISSPAFLASEHKEKAQPLARSIIQKKFPAFPGQVKELVIALKKADHTLLGEEWRKIGNVLERSFLSLQADENYLNNVRSVPSSIKSIVDAITEGEPAASYMTVPNVSNSTLYCEGDVSVTDKGCVNATIQSGGHVHVLGVVRGGRVFGEKGITIGEAGSGNSMPALLAVPAGQRIRIGKAMEGVVVNVGNRTYQFTETAYHVKAVSNADGEITVDYRRN